MVSQATSQAVGPSRERAMGVQARRGFAVGGPLDVPRWAAAAPERSTFQVGVDAPYGETIKRVRPSLHCAGADFASTAALRPSH